MIILFHSLTTHIYLQEPTGTKDKTRFFECSQWYLLYHMIAKFCQLSNHIFVVLINAHVCSQNKTKQKYQMSNYSLSNSDFQWQEIKYYITPSMSITFTINFPYYHCIQYQYTIFQICKLFIFSIWKNIDKTGTLK